MTDEMDRERSRTDIIGNIEHALLMAQYRTAAQSNLEFVNYTSEIMNYRALLIAIERGYFYVMDNIIKEREVVAEKQRES